MSRRTRKRFPQTLVAKGFSPRRLKRSQVGKVECVDYKGNQLCAIGGKYAVSVRLYAKGESYPNGKWLPVAEGGARTVKTALRAGKQFLRRVKMRSR